MWRPAEQTCLYWEEIEKRDMTEFFLVWFFVPTTNHNTDEKEENRKGKKGTSKNQKENNNKRSITHSVYIDCAELKWRGVVPPLTSATNSVSLAPVIFVAPNFSSVWRIKDQSIVSSSSFFLLWRRFRLASHWPQPSDRIDLFCIAFTSMPETKRPAHSREYPAQHTQGEPVMPGQSFLSYQEETFFARGSK